MLKTKYRSFQNYLKSGKLPGKWRSGMSNFRRDAKKFELNEEGNLVTKMGNLIVVQNFEKKAIWEDVHSHSGRDKTIARFNER